MPTFTDDELNALAADSYAGQERDLADALNDDALEYYEAMTEFNDDQYGSWALFNLLMMNTGCFILLTAGNGVDNLMLRHHIQENANDGTGETFHDRLEQRIRGRQELRRLAGRPATVPTHFTTIDDSDQI